MTQQLLISIGSLPFCTNDNLQGSGITHGLFRVAAETCGEGSDVFKHQGFGLVGEDSWLAAIDAKAVVLKQACHGDGREPAQMGAIQEPAVLVDELAKAEPCLKTPMLCIGNAGTDHPALREEAIPKDPALSLEQGSHSGLVRHRRVNFDAQQVGLGMTIAELRVRG